MGCPCREIRAAIELLPGGRFLTGLLPALPPTKGPSMKMLAPVAGQRFQLAHGPHYQADADRIVHVETADVAEMRRVGCTEAPSLRTPEVEQVLDAIKEAHRNPIAYVAMPGADDTPESQTKQASTARAAIDAARGVQIAPQPETPAPGSLAELAAALPDSAVPVEEPVPLGLGVEPAAEHLPQ
jgi:hypothetical protein